MSCLAGLKFDGTLLFPERRAYTAVYPLSDDEALLYKRVTEYLTEEMNRADRLKVAGIARRLLDALVYSPIP